MQGIVKGKTLMERIHNAFTGEFVKSGKHNKPLNNYLSKLNNTVRTVFHGNVNNMSRFLHQLPIVWRFIRPRLNKVNERDEQLQAQRLIDQLQLLNESGVDGAFISTFVFPINPYDDNPRYDLDRESASLVKSYAGGKHGISYPDMT